MKMARLIALVLLVSSAVFAQTPAVPTAPTQPPPPVLKGSIAGHPGWPAAKPEDVRSVDAIVGALYDVISGPKGQARDWDRFRSLFLPDARLIPIRAGSGAQASDVVILNIDE